MPAGTSSRISTPVDTIGSSKLLESAVRSSFAHVGARRVNYLSSEAVA